MLTEDEYKIALSESSWKISRGNIHIGHGVKYNNLDPLTVISFEGSLNVTEMLTLSMWHG